MRDPQLPSQTADVILLGGASGSGKSYLADQFGDPHLSLDDYYREQAEDAVNPLPRTAYGEIDWDDARTWNGEMAVAAIQELLSTGETSAPKYSLAESAYRGRRRLRRRQGGPVVAEGIFAADALRLLREAGVDVTAIYVDTRPLPTALVRFARDVAEKRKPIPFLLKRGWTLYRADSAIRRAALEAGFVPLRKPAVKRVLRELSATSSS